jgi:transcriptional regulator with XRE-family HTH domain
VSSLKAKLTPEQVTALRSVPLGHLPNKVRIARYMLGLKQGQIASAIGLAVPQLSDIERGDYKDVPLEKSRLVAEFFGCPIEDLFPSREVA